LLRAIDQKALAGESAIKAGNEMKKALTQAEKPKPDKNTLVEHLKKATGLVKGVSGLAEAFAKAITTVGLLF